MDSLRKFYEHLLQCCLEIPTWSPGEVTQIIKWVGAHDDAMAGRAIVIVNLAQGRYGLLVANAAGSGHNRPCYTRMRTAETLGLLMREFSNDELDQILGVELGGTE